MIAKTDPHYEDDMLRSLLDERLSRTETQEVESHLETCSSCQRELKRIAGAENWWNETVTVLSDSTFVPGHQSPHVDDPESIASRVASSDLKSDLSDSQSIDASIAWIQPLLAKPSEGSVDCIGQLDQYPIRRVIGQGGMGVVLRGTDLELNRPVAVKVLSPHLAGVGAARARFMREAQAAAAIVHPSIVPIYGIIQTGPLPYLVMPVIEGGNLQQRIDNEGPLELAEVLRIGAQIAEGLAAAHRSGVIHRDIKPANILVEEGNGRVLISDFGLARALDDATLTCSGMIAGTPQFMSPEQARGEAVDARSDLFSLGSLLYALATGRPPFRAETPLAVLRKITETQARKVHEINEQFPAWFDVLVRRFMQIDISQRIGSASEAAELLHDAHAHVRNPTAKPLPSVLENRVHSIRTKAGWLAASVIVAGAVFALLDWSNRGSKPISRTKKADPQTLLSPRETLEPTYGPSPQAHYPQAQYRQPSRFPSYEDGDRAFVWQDIEFMSEIQTLNLHIDVIQSITSADWVSPFDVPTEAKIPLQSQGTKDSQQ